MPGKSKNKRKKTKYHTDEQGHYVWDNFFVRGKQKRTKRRVTVIDGEVIDDMDSWLPANAGDDLLHQIERWDLIERRQSGEEGPPTKANAMKPSPRILQLDIHQVESAFEFLAGFDPGLHDGPCFAFLDLTTGAIAHTEDEEETEEMFGDGNFLRLPDDLFEDLQWGALDEFVDSLADEPLRGQLERAISGKGAFRRFKDIVFGGGNVALKHQWSWFETRRKRERIAQWLRDENIEPDWGRDIFEAPPLPDKRADLLRAVLVFVRNARVIPGVRRIALLGSLATSKAIPKDVDLLVGVDDDMPLDTLARLSRRLSGATMATGDGCGADVFLHNPQGQYLGRVCLWKQCAPGIRMSCQARHCGRREYLSDDLQNVRLDAKLIAAPPVMLWSEIVIHADLPQDVRELLVSHLG
jgi:hypothetical protein